MLEESIVNIPSICLTDDTPELSAEPKYDEYTDDYNIVSLEQFVAGFSWRNDGFRQMPYQMKDVWISSLRMILRKINWSTQ
jgi:hypothetical protein